VSRDPFARQWSVTSDRKLLTSRQLVDLLAQLRKPIHCRAKQVDTNSIISLDCEQPDDSLHGFMRQSAAFVLARIRQRWTDTDEASVDVLVSNEYESNVVSFETFAHWLESYAVDGIAVQYLYDPPPEDAIRVGARLAVHISRRADPSSEEHKR
jgi:hypothetical protein